MFPFHVPTKYADGINVCTFWNLVNIKMWRTDDLFIWQNTTLRYNYVTEREKPSFNISHTVTYRKFCAGKRGPKGTRKLRWGYPSKPSSEGRAKVPVINIHNFSMSITLRNILEITDFNTIKINWRTHIKNQSVLTTQTQSVIAKHHKFEKGIKCH